MTEQTAHILRHFSAREWERAELLGFAVPDYGRVTIINHTHKLRGKRPEHVAGYTRQPRLRGRKAA